MERELQGRYIVTSTLGEKVEAFIPKPLPPVPPIHWDPSLREKFDQALIALGRLDSLAILLPETSLFLYMYIRKEAVLSSMIEGTQSSLSDLLLYEIDQEPGVPLDDVQEVSNYVAALNYGLERVSNGFPLSLRLLREIHQVLLSKGRGEQKQPGEFRRSQNWIGGTRPGNAMFVPPPPEHLNECLGSLELFINDKPSPTSTLLKAALSHVQFETIHPFLDGNGRLGRLLITLVLCQKGVLSEPMLYLSLYFKSNRQQYYELLNRVRTHGDWESWLDFFVEAVHLTASQAVGSAQQVLSQSKQDQEKMHQLGRSYPSTQIIFQSFLKNPILTPTKIVEKTGITAATVNKCLAHLIDLGILTELTSQKRNRMFSYSKYIEIISEGIDVE